MRRTRRTSRAAASPLAVLLCLVAARVTVASTSIDPSVAPLFVGEQVVVEGEVHTADREGNVVHLYLGAPPHDLRLSLVLGLLTDFPDFPEQYYAGKTVRAAGTLDLFRDRVEMVVRDPRNIRVVDVAAPVTVPEAAMAPEAVTVGEEDVLQDRLDALGEQLRRIEERLDRLERAGEAEGSPTSGD